MAKATINISYPSTRADGSALPTNRIGGAHVLKQQQDGSFAVIGAVTYPSTTFQDPVDLVPGTYFYKASVFDTDPAVAEGELSTAAEANVVGVDAPPAAPTITVTVA